MGRPAGEREAQNPALHRWLSPQDPSTNHNIVCNTHHMGTATWFFEGTTYKGWKSTSSKSLLWIHGKHVPLSLSAAWCHLMTSLIRSWLWQEHTLVRTAFISLSMIIESLVFLQFYNYRRCENHVQCWSSLDGILLFRFLRHQQTALVWLSPFPSHPTFFLLWSLLWHSIMTLFWLWRWCAAA